MLSQRTIRLLIVFLTAALTFSIVMYFRYDIIRSVFNIPSNEVQPIYSPTYEEQEFVPPSFPPPEDTAEPNVLTITSFNSGWNYIYAESKFVAIQTPPNMTRTLSGAVHGNVASIVVTHTPPSGKTKDQDVYKLKSFKEGDTVWKYTVGAQLENYEPGLNHYYLQALDSTNKEIGALQILIIARELNASSSSLSDATLGELDIEWTSPRAETVENILKRSPDYEEKMRVILMHLNYHNLTGCMFGNDITAGTSSTWLDQKYLQEESQYIDLQKVGRVKSGAHAGAELFAMQFKKAIDGGCWPGPRRIGHFMQDASGSLWKVGKAPVLWLEPILQWDGSNVTLTEPVVTMSDAVTLEYCKECDVNIAYKNSPPPLASFSTTERPVYSPGDGCFEILRPDGFINRYKMRVDERIKWNDGTMSTSNYVSGLVYDSCSQHEECHWVSDISNSELTRVGTTVEGLEVYQETITPTELAAMSSGTSLLDIQPILSLYELYWLLPRYQGATVPTPAEFVALHPAIYIKDPIGRFLYFRGETYGPQVECGKPVIYLYPEQAQDVAVRVEPTGGMTVSDPEYGDGWFVHATPEGSLHNYADGKTYPYLFWEGHGTEYTRPNRGFVVAKADVPTFLQEKLALLGMVGQEIDDFRDFWEPKLMESPYVFVTFLPQSEFDEIAPLTVDPKPDTVIRVFMDYAPLQAPMRATPPIITTPKREGFTVVEWGGALHSSIGFSCPDTVLLQ